MTKWFSLVLCQEVEFTIVVAVSKRRGTTAIAAAALAYGGVPQTYSLMYVQPTPNRTQDPLINSCSGDHFIFNRSHSTCSSASLCFSHRQKTCINCGTLCKLFLSSFFHLRSVQPGSDSQKSRCTQLTPFWLHAC